MDQYIMYTSSPEETMSIAEKLGEVVEKGTVITLEGDLGAGKTHFTKGLAKGLNVKKTVNSPTFTIIKEYNGRLPLYHMDVYRVDHADEDLGFDEYFFGDGITIVEWASLIEDQLPLERLAIDIFHEGDQKRKVVISPLGEKYKSLCKELFGK